MRQRTILNLREATYRLENELFSMSMKRASY